MTEGKENEKVKSGKISRRDFLKDAGLVVGGATIGSISVLNACKGGKTTETVANTNTITKTTTVTAPGSTGVTTITVTATSPVSTTSRVINLVVNGGNYQIEVDSKSNLKYVLHDLLGFISIKEMCTEHGACGSCTVIMNGRPIVSCMALAIECDGAKIQTAEGIALANHPIVEAYILNECMQCGYCTPGLLVTAKALLDKNQSPTQADILIALSGNICRCGTYPVHITAVQQAALALKGGS
jgi:aerobic-type carbon monoxide dehydrogenase small subunit (CoxS/CutS family)